jgi:hypothetical protein
MMSYFTYITGAENRTYDITIIAPWIEAFIIFAERNEKNFPIFLKKFYINIIIRYGSKM